MDKKPPKTAEDRLLEMLIKDYITTTEYYEMLKRIKKEK